jgi:hypothetical protein
MILVDTNILAPLPNGQDPQRELVKSALVSMMKRGEELVVAPQCIYEFWVIVTRPSSDKGMGFSGARAERWVTRIERMCRLLPDDLGVYSRWKDLVSATGTAGKAAHDGHLVA